jgi:hypothetical protein
VPAAVLPAERRRGRGLAGHQDLKSKVFICTVDLGCE